MKQFLYYIIFFCFSLFTGIQVSAQCEPDANCTDINNTGAFCPVILPDIILNEPYEAVLTIIPPSEHNLQGTILDIAYIEIDSVLNFPPGITYAANAGRFYADSAYCVLLSGIPTQAGTFTLTLYVTPYINIPLFGILKGPQTIDNTSVVLTVQEVTSTDFPNLNQFEVLENVPNPFLQSTKIGFYTPVSDNIDLKIYTMLGELIYQESRMAVPGEHFFRFDGSELLAGSYLYLVTSSTSSPSTKTYKGQVRFGII
jgi:hypothetical protein